eukprot:1480867-Prymnesium_polylepis.1
MAGLRAIQAARQAIAPPVESAADIGTAERDDRIAELLQSLALAEPSAPPLPTGATDSDVTDEEEEPAAPAQRQPVQPGYLLAPPSLPSAATLSRAPTAPGMEQQPIAPRPPADAL